MTNTKLVTEDKKMSLFLYIITDIVHMMGVVLLCEMFFRFEKREIIYNKFMQIALVLFIVVVSAGLYLDSNDIFEFIVYIFAICVTLCCLCNEKIYITIIGAIWIMVIIGLFDNMSIVLFELIGNIFGYNNSEISRLFCSLISLIYVYTLGRLYNRKYSAGIRTIGIWNLLAFTVLNVIDTVLVTLLAIIAVDEKNDKIRIVYTIVFILVILGLFVQLGAVILLLLQRNVYKEKKLITEKYLDEQKNHYEYLEKREIETKKFRHDLRNHMQMLSDLAKERRYDEFYQYLDKINMKIDSFGNVITVQNGIVDAIINRYYSEALSKNIKMDVNGRFPSDCDIGAYDLCTIFSNLLSNALEGTSEAEDKWITVDCRYTDNNIIVVVKNSFKNDNQYGNGKNRTSKEDTEYHGYGLENVKDSIMKYNGVWDIEVKDNLFIVTILFNYLRMD